MRRKISLFVLAIAVALVMAAPAFGAARPTAAAAPSINVFAAASLSHVFPAMVPKFKKAYPQYKNAKFVFNFQGTDVLVAQIQLGAPADVFAGASAKYGTQLFKGGFIEPPQNFCQNKLTVIMPKNNPAHLKALSDLATPGVLIAVGDPAVPIGTYTRTVLTNLNALYPQFAAPNTYSALVTKNVVSNEVNVNAVVALVKLGEVDAGFVYISDAKSAGTSVTKITIPDAYQSNPLPTYPIARTASAKTAGHATIARLFVKFVLGAKGQKMLKAYGFLPKPPAAS